MANTVTSAESRLNQLPEFEYHDELVGGQIRLLKLIATHEDGTMDMELRTVDLPTRDENKESTRLKYIALSYTWGDLKADKLPIIVNGRRFMVLPNLYAALVYLEPEMRENEIWIDAISIHQDDARNGQEKDNQLTQMGDVYYLAEKVLVFLGIPFRASDRAIQDMDRIGRLALDAGIDLLTERIMAHWPSLEGLEVDERERIVQVKRNLDTLIDSQRGGLFSSPKIATEEILRILQRPWFTRAWVVQELSIPEPGRVSFACGTARVSFEHLWATTFFLKLMSERAVTVFFSLPGWLANTELAQRLMQHMFRLETGTYPTWPDVRAATTLGIRRRYLRGKLDRSLRALLVTLYVGDMAVPLESSQKEDKIRSILSLTSPEDRRWLDPAIRAASNWQQLYTVVARRLIHQGHIDILSLCKGSREGLPSWVPNWSERIRAPWSGLKHQGGSRQGVRLFTAGGDTVVDVNNSDDRDVCLPVSGRHVDTIREVGSRWAANLGDPFNWTAGRMMLDEVERFLAQSAHYSEQQKEEGKWRIPIGDKELVGLGSHRRPTGASHTRATEASRSGWSAMRRAMEHAKPEGAYNSAEKVSFICMMSCMHGSRPFISDLGYVGLCPDSAKPGDSIFIPGGSHVPYVIRRAGGQGDLEQSTLLGESFVYGIMHNELGHQRPGSSVIRYRLR